MVVELKKKVGVGEAIFWAIEVKVKQVEVKAITG